MFGKDAGSMPEPGKIPQRLIYDLGDVATLLGGVTQRYVEQLVAEGVLPSVKLGRRRMVEHDALLAFVAELREAHATASESVAS